MEESCVLRPVFKISLKWQCSVIHNTSVLTKRALMQERLYNIMSKYLQHNDDHLMNTQLPKRQFPLHTAHEKGTDTGDAILYYA